MENQDLCPVRTHKASSSAEATANVASVLGELTNTLKQIVTDWTSKKLDWLQWGKNYQTHQPHVNLLIPLNK